MKTTPIITIAALSVFALLSNGASACSFASGYAGFTPDPENFKPRFDKRRFVAILPAPTVQVDNITRGVAGTGFSCNDAGIITITLVWPETTPYQLDEIGFYFRAPHDQLPDLIFPLGPIQPVKKAVDNNKATFYFVWLDGHPTRQPAIDTDLEVFAVNRGLQIGKSTSIRLRAAPGQRS